MPNDGVQFDDIAKIFKHRDEMRAKEQQRKEKLEARASLQSHAARSSAVAHKKASGESGGITYLEYSPAKDVYVLAKRPSQTIKGPQTAKGKNRRKSTQVSKKSHRPEHLKAKPKTMSPLVKSILGISGAVVLGASAYGATRTFSNSDGDTFSLATLEPVVVESVNSSVNAEPNNNGIDDIIILDGEQYEVEFNRDESAAVNELKSDESSSVEDETETLSLDERLEEIFANDPGAETAFNDIKNTLSRITDAIGEDSVEFIRRTRDTYAPRVSLPMLICVFEQESGGRMWNPDGSLLVGSSNDTGIGQITPKCEEDVNGRLNPDGKIRCKEDPYDNIEITAISLQDHCRVWGFDINSYDDEANMETIPYVLSSYNAGDGNVRKYGLRETYVKECFNEHLSYMLKYPEFSEYFGCEDFID